VSVTLSVSVSVSVSVSKCLRKLEHTKYQFSWLEGALRGWVIMVHSWVIPVLSVNHDTSNNATRRASAGAAGKITVPFSKQRKSSPPSVIY
jgi:hypothetical protein